MLFNGFLRSLKPGLSGRLAFVVLGMLLAVVCRIVPAHDASPVVRIDATMSAVDLWPAVRLLAESGQELTPQQAWQRAAQFTPPAGPHANLGARRDTVWLWVRLEMAADAPPRWIFDVGYPSIDRVDVFQVVDGRVIRAVRLGDELLVAERPLPSRTHAVELVLDPRVQRHDLLLRVKTTSSMIVPLGLLQWPDFQSREAGAEALQGMFAGIGALLMIYSLVHWFALRDRIFGYYAASIGGTTLFFLAYNGLAPEHLWPASLWLTQNAGVLSILVALWGGFLFLERTLRVVELSRPVSWSMTALAWFALAVGIAYIVGLIDYPVAQTISTLLGPMPMLLGVPIAYQRMRRGERVMGYLLAGWGLYAIGVAVMAALLRGMAPSNALTQHAFQIGSMSEMTLWLVLLGQRVEAMRRLGEHAHRERDALRSLALTDALTGLPNRRGLEPILAEAIHRSRPEQVTAVFMIDLDGFKAVNDRHGHAVGDRLLVAAAKRLRQHVRRSDCVARLGGDEFVVVAEGFTAATEARQFGDKLIEAFDSAFQLSGGTVCQVGLTIGYALAPLDGRDAPGLLRRADVAMYAGKQDGKHCLRRAAASVEPALA